MRELRISARSLGSDVFWIPFEACAHGASLPGEGRIKKPTALLTNCCLLWPLARICKCPGLHVKLEGTFHVHGKWVSRTAYAGAYAPLLVRRWTALLEPLRGDVGTRGVILWRKLVLALHQH